jgi:hypothetical protein
LQLPTEQQVKDRVTQFNKEALNTLNEIAAALGNNPNFSTTMLLMYGNTQSAINSMYGNITTAQSNISNTQFIINGIYGNVINAQSIINSTYGNVINAQSNITTLNTNITPITYVSGISVFSTDISLNGNLTVLGNVKAYSFRTVSDYRIKENPKTLDFNFTVENLRPLSYKNKLTDQLDIGFLAHEMAEIYPYLVSGVKDGPEYQSINYSALIALLVKEIQVLKTKVQNLEEKQNII